MVSPISGSSLFVNGLKIGNDGDSEPQEDEDRNYYIQMVMNMKTVSREVAEAEVDAFY